MPNSGTMRVSDLICVSLLFLAAALPAAGQCMPLDPALAAGKAFSPGERLTYIAHYQWGALRMDVGTADVSLDVDTLYGDRTLLHATAVGRTYRFWDMFFKVRDMYESKFYQDDILPVYFHRDVHEGKYTVLNYYRWDPSTRYIDATVVKPDRTVDTLLPGHGCTFDILTLLYHARNMDFDALAQGVNNPVSFAIDEEIFDIYFRYIGREVKKVPGKGSFRTLKFAAKVVAGEVFTGEEEMIIWVSDDMNRVPLYFESPVRVGSVCGRLAGWENLKYPFDSMIPKNAKKKR